MNDPREAMKPKPSELRIRRSKNPLTPALHEQYMIDLANELGIPTEKEGEYVGLTYDAITERLRAHKTMAAALNAKEHELIELKRSISGLRYWVSQNMSIPNIDTKTDVELINAVRGILEMAKTAFTACWPVVQTMWGNVSYTLRQAGILPGNQSPTGRFPRPASHPFHDVPRQEKPSRGYTVTDNLIQEELIEMVRRLRG